MKTTISEAGNVIRGPGAPQGNDRSMGAMLIDAGLIRPEDAERILRHSKERAMRFGDAALALGLVKSEDIQQALARQFDYPYLRAGQSKVSPEVVAAWAPFSKQVEALRALRSQLLLRWFTGEADHKSLAIVSADRGDGRSHIAANLAVVFSQLGERTLLIDADMRAATQHVLFGLSNSAGLSTVLAERAGLDVVQRVPAFVDLSVLPAGPTPPNPLELLGRGTFSKLMADVAANFDVVIVDTPPAVQGSDFQLIATKSNGALLVARRNRTGANECRAVVDAIAAANALLVGSVLNDY